MLVSNLFIIYFNLKFLLGNMMFGFFMSGFNVEKVFYLDLDEMFYKEFLFLFLGGCIFVGSGVDDFGVVFVFMNGFFLFFFMSLAINYRELDFCWLDVEVF